VAEDNATNREVIFAQLSKLGYRGVVTNGMRPWRRCSGSALTCMMDCQMRYGWLRSSAPNSALDRRRIPIIALTASAMPVQGAMPARGHGRLLAKPVELPHLPRCSLSDSQARRDISNAKFPVALQALVEHFSIPNQCWQTDGRPGAGR